MSVARARHLRRIATPAEKNLWARLRNRQLAGLEFRRQQPIGDRILDFYCAEARLAVELDGSGHACHAQSSLDLERELELRNEGIRVLRFWNRAVFDNLDGVLNAIIYAADPERSLWRTPTIEGRSDAETKSPTGARNLKSQKTRA
jgi:very-short-patch-repair endonuclease